MYPVKLPRVSVLLSTYNGEKYIVQQLDSILNQTYPEIEIYVRDDGSKDGTLKILERYEKKNIIHVERGKNIGFVKSFFWLLANCGDASYYAFSDQDDVWLKDKIEIAVERLQETNAEKPTLYCSNYDFYDENLNLISHRRGKEPNIGFHNSIVDSYVAYGFTCVFNQTARNLVTRELPQNAASHDWWLYMVCAGMGEVIYDKQVTVKYRRHGNNTSPEGFNFCKHQIWRLNKFFLSGYFLNIREQIKEYEEIFGNQLSKADKRVLSLFTKESFHPLIAFKKVCYPKAFRQSIIDEIMLRIIFLIGQL